MKDTRYALDSMLATLRDLPLPPAGVNHQYLGNHRLTPEMREYRDALTAVLNTYRQEQSGSLMLYPDRVTRAAADKARLDVVITWWLPPRSYVTRDLDGLGKLPIDTVFAWLGLDDRYIVRLVQSKHRTPLIGSFMFEMYFSSESVDAHARRISLD